MTTKDKTYYLPWMELMEGTKEKKKKKRERDTKCPESDSFRKVRLRSKEMERKGLGLRRSEINRQGDLQSTHFTGFQKPLTLSERSPKELLLFCHSKCQGVMLL